MILPKELTTVTQTSKMLAIIPTNAGKESVFDYGEKTDVRDIIFAGKHAREYPRRLTIGNGERYVRYIRIDDIQNLPWERYNEINYAVEKADFDQLEIFDQILSTFRFD